MPKTITSERLHALADERRRAVLTVLGERADGTATLSGLAEELAAMDDVGDGGRPDRGQIEIGLHHRDLPKLVDAGIISYDARTHEVKYESDSSLERLLAASAELPSGRA